VLDIKARDAAGSEYLLEMQLFAKASFPGRLLYYAAKHYSQQLKEGEGYERLRPVIVICFVNAVLFPQSPGYHGRYELMDEKSGVRYSDHMAIHVLELPKFPKTVDELCEDEDRWTYFLRYGSELDPTNLPESLSIPEIRQATGTLTMLSLSEIEREQYESRLKRSRDEEASLRYATETALEQGLEQGRTEEARSILLRSGVRRHGSIPAEVLSALQAITDCEQLEALVDRMFDGHGWETLLDSQ